MTRLLDNCDLPEIEQGIVPLWFVPATPNKEFY